MQVGTIALVIASVVLLSVATLWFAASRNPRAAGDVETFSDSWSPVSTLKAAVDVLQPRACPLPGASYNMRLKELITDDDVGNVILRRTEPDSFFCYLAGDDAAVVANGDCAGLGKRVGSGNAMIGRVFPFRAQALSENLAADKCVFEILRSGMTGSNTAALEDVIGIEPCVCDLSGLEGRVAALLAEVADMSKNPSPSPDEYVRWRDAALSNTDACALERRVCDMDVLSMSTVSATGVTEITAGFTACLSNYDAASRRRAETQDCCANAAVYQKRYNEQVAQGEALQRAYLNILLQGRITDADDAALSNMRSRIGVVKNGMCVPP